MLTDVKLRKLIAFTPLIIIPFIHGLTEALTQHLIPSNLIRPYITSLILASLVVLLFLVEVIVASFLFTIDEFLILIISMILSFVIYVGIDISILLILLIITIVAVLKLGVFKSASKSSIKEFSISLAYLLDNVKNRKDLVMQSLGLLFVLLGLAIIIQKVFIISNYYLYLLGVIINGLFSLAILAKSNYALLFIPLALLSWLSIPITYSTLISFGLPKVDVEISEFIDLGLVKQKLITKRKRISWIYVKKPTHCIVPLKTTTSLHMMICGMSGSGKSTYLKYLVRELLRKNIEVLLIDPHGEHVHLAEELGGKAIPLGYNMDITHIIQSQYVELRNTISFITSTSKQQVSRVFDELLEKLNEKNRILLIDLLKSLKLWKVEKIEKLREFGAGFKPLRIIDLSKAQNITIEKIVLELALRYIWSKYSLAVSDNIRCAILIDEIYRFLDSNWQVTAPSLGKILREGRKYGIVIVMTSQRVSSLPHDVITNTGIKLYFKLVDPREIGFAIASLALPTHTAEKLMKKTLAEIDVGSAILVIPMLNLIAVIEIPLKYARV